MKERGSARERCVELRRHTEGEAERKKEGARENERKRERKKVKARESKLQLTKAPG